MLHKVWIVGEVVILAVLKHKDAIVLQEALLEDQRGDGGQFLQGIGRVGKDEVELLLARFDKAEHVATDGHTHLGVELLQTLLDEAVVVAILFDADHMTAAARYQFERDAACTREEVEGCGIFKVDVLHQHVEDVLLGEVRCWSRLE